MKEKKIEFPNGGYLKFGYAENPDPLKGADTERVVLWIEEQYFVTPEMWERLSDKVFPETDEELRTFDQIANTDWSEEGE